MEARAEHQRTRNYNVLYGVDTALGVLVVALVFIWILCFHTGFAWQSSPQLEFNWHPMLMVLGLVFLYSQSMLVYRTGRSRPKKSLKLVHASLHLAAFVFSVVGLKAAFDSHDLAVPSRPNLYTLHSWVGLIAVVLFAGQLAFGFAAFLYPGLSPGLRAALLPVHAHLGAAIFAAAVAAALLGILEKNIFALGQSYQTLPPEGVLMNVTGVLLLCFGLLSLYLVNDGGYKRSALPEENMTLADSEQDQ